MIAYPRTRKAADMTARRRWDARVPADGERAVLPLTWGLAHSGSLEGLLRSERCATMQPMTGNHFRGSRLILAATCLVASLTVIVPTADLFIFGIHGHVGAGKPIKLSEAHTGEGSGSQRSHHCDIWVNPMELAVPHPMPGPAAAAPLLAQEISSPVLYQPFVLFRPPRV